MARKWITRDEIADIWEQLGVNTMKEGLAKVAENPLVTRYPEMDKAFDYYETADQIREIDKITPLIFEQSGNFVSPVRSGRSNW